MPILLYGSSFRALKFPLPALLSRAARTASTHQTKPFLGLQYLKKPQMSDQDVDVQPVAKKPRLQSPTPTLSEVQLTTADMLLPSPGPSESAPPSAATLSLLGDLTGAIHGAIQRPITKKYEFKKKNRLPEPFSKEDIVQKEVFALLGTDVVNAAMNANTEWSAPYERQSEVELTVSCLSASGMFPSPPTVHHLYVFRLIFAHR